jgi:hypothetical protein
MRFRCVSSVIMLEIEFYSNAEEITYSMP